MPPELTSQTSGEQGSGDDGAGAGPSAVSYDDLLSMTSEDAGDGSGSADDEKKETPADDEEAEKGESDDTEEQATEKPEPKAKPKEEKKAGYLAKTKDGKELELSGDLTFVKKIDGKDVEVTLDQALRHEAFDIPYRRKLQEAADEKKKVDGEREQLEAKTAAFQEQVHLVAGQLRTAHGALQKGDSETFFTAYADLVGVHPTKLKSFIRKSLLPEMQQYLEADEDERKRLDLQEQAAYLNDEEKNQQTKAVLQQRLGTFQQQARAQISSAGITEQEWAEAEKQVVKEALKGRWPQYAKLTDLQAKEYIETVVSVAQGAKQEARISRLVSEVDPDLSETDPDEYQRLSDVIAPFVDTYDESDLKALVAEALGVKAKAKGDEDEDGAAPIDDDQPYERSRRKPASNSKHDDDDELARIARQVEDDPLSVYGR